MDDGRLSRGTPVASAAATSLLCGLQWGVTAAGMSVFLGPRVLGTVSHTASTVMVAVPWWIVPLFDFQFVGIERTADEPTARRMRLVAFLGLVGGYALGAGLFLHPTILGCAILAFSFLHCL
jgi:hypothetical protein